MKTSNTLYAVGKAAGRRNQGYLLEEELEGMVSLEPEAGETDSHFGRDPLFQ